MKYSVYLRPFKITDAEKINKWRNDEEIQKLTCGRYRKVSLEIEKNWVQEKMTHNSVEEYFSICLNDGTDEMIGYFCIRDIDFYNRRCVFGGVVIDPDYRDGAYMVDTHLLALEYAFVHLGMNRVSGSCLEEHTISRVMVEMLGFELEGIEKESLYKAHTYHNVCKYAIRYSIYSALKETGQYSLMQIAKRAKKIMKQYKQTK